MRVYSQQVEKTHYETEGYMDIKRWTSYYYQYDLAREVLGCVEKKALNILEIGVGNGIMKDLLTKFGNAVTTMDIAKDLNPDIVLGLPSVPGGKKYDLVLCCEVLEHVEFGDAVKSLENLAKISKYLVISVPNRTPYLSVQLKLPLRGPLNLVISLPFHRVPLKLGGEHYWEIGAFGISTNKLKNEMKNAGFKVIKDFRVAQNPWHHFFLLESNEK